VARDSRNAFLVTDATPVPLPGPAAPGPARRRDGGDPGARWPALEHAAPSRRGDFRGIPRRQRRAPPLEPAPGIATSPEPVAPDREAVWDFDQSPVHQDSESD
jgi:hypothetical protein